MKLYNQQESKEIEKAIVFMIDCFSKCCMNKKPVILHSINVGLKLMSLEKPVELVQAGILHDLIEDSDCTGKDIKNEFGESVANLVSTLTFDKTITDYKERWQEAIQRIIDAGTDAMIIKVVDNMLNFPYYIKILDKKKREELIWKYKFTIKSFEQYLKGNNLFEEYKKAVSGVK